MHANQVGLWRYLRFLGCPDHEVEDLLQETFVAVWRTSFQLRSAGEARAYLRTVARNVFLTACRKAKRAPTVRQLDEADHTWNEVARGDGDRYIQALRQCVGLLDDRSRRALQLRYEDGCSRAQMAAALRIGVEGVKTLLRRVRNRLEACVRSRVGS